MLHVVAEGVASNDVAEDMGTLGTEEQASVEHGLEGEALTNGKRLAPRGTDVAEASLAVELGQVVGNIGVGRLEACTTGGEVPVVFRIIVCLGTIA